MLFFVKLNQEFSSNLSIVFIFVSCEEKGYYRVVSAAQLSFDFQSYSERSRRMQGRGIKWSLRAFASMRAVRLFLRAQAVINFVMRAASSSKITNGDQRALFSLWKCCFAPSNLVVTPSKQDNRRNARQHVRSLSRFNHSQQLTANYALFSYRLLQGITPLSFTRVK